MNFFDEIDVKGCDAIGAITHQTENEVTKLNDARSVCKSIIVLTGRSPSVNNNNFQIFYQIERALVFNFTNFAYQSPS